MVKLRPKITEKITDTTFVNSPFLFPFYNSDNHTNSDSVNYSQVEARDDREINYQVSLWPIKCSEIIAGLWTFPALTVPKGCKSKFFLTKPDPFLYQELT